MEFNLHAANSKYSAYAIRYTVYKSDRRQARALPQYTLVFEIRLSRGFNRDVTDIAFTKRTHNCNWVKIELGTKLDHPTSIFVSYGSN